MCRAKGDLWFYLRYCERGVICVNHPPYWFWVWAGERNHRRGALKYSPPHFPSTLCACMLTRPSRTPLSHALLCTSLARRSRTPLSYAALARPPLLSMSRRSPGMNLWINYNSGDGSSSRLCGRRHRPRITTTDQSGRPSVDGTQRKTNGKKTACKERRWLGSVFESLYEGLTCSRCNARSLYQSADILVVIGEESHRNAFSCHG